MFAVQLHLNTNLQCAEKGTGVNVRTKVEPCLWKTISRSQPGSLSVEFCSCSSPCLSAIYVWVLNFPEHIKKCLLPWVQIA